MNQTICTKCKTEFVCGATGNDPCWCTRLSNIVPVSSQECMCPYCLVKEISEIKKETLRGK
jgi:hypothetical protein